MLMLGCSDSSDLRCGLLQCTYTGNLLFIYYMIDMILLVVTICYHFFGASLANSYL